MVSSTRNHPSNNSHRVLQPSTTLNRRYVKRPAPAKKISSTTISKNLALERRRKIAEEINKTNLSSIRRGYLAAPSQTTRKLTPVLQEKNATQKPATRSTSTKPTIKSAHSTPAAHPYQAIVRSRLAAKAKKPLPTAKELKDQAISKALLSVAAVSEQEAAAAAKKSARKKRRLFNNRRAAIAFACALISVASLGYFVHRSFPDISVRVTAMQAGFEVRYPSFIPEGYYISGITTEKPAKVTMKFIKGNHDFTLSEERSAWDSQSLLHNYVKPTFGDQYTTAREQGITVFLSGTTSACWVNGGVLYKITTSGNLDKFQLHNLIHSL